MIRLTMTDEQCSIELRTDAPYSPDVLDDMVTRAILLKTARVTVNEDITP